MACSADLPEVMAKFAAKHHIPFPLLSDPDFQAIEIYGARRMKMFLGKSFLGIVRSSFLVDPQGNIARAWPSARAKGHAEEVLEALEKM